MEHPADPAQSRLVAGRYRLMSPLGSGGMGTVWRAEDVLLGREVAVKEVTFPHGLSDADRDVLRERTRREARAAARLDHPSAVTVFDVVEEGDSPFLVMELVEARTLSQVVRSDGPLSPQRTAQVGLALLGALETAHAQGIVHRDVKPGNVLLCPDEGATPGRVVLTDFGIASSPGDSSLTHTGLLLGSPSYIAPERAKGLAPGPESDLWSLGATMFAAVEGKPPYDGGEPLLTVTAVVTGEHAPYLAAGPLAPVLEGLLEREPDKRLTPQAARAALAPIAASPPQVRAPLAVPAPEAERRADRTTALPMQDVREAAAPAVVREEPEIFEQEAPVGAPPTARQPVRRRPLLVIRDPPPSPPASGRSRAPIVLLAAVLLVGAAVVGVAAVGGDSGSGRPSAGPGASTAPSSAASPESGRSSQASPQASAPTAQAGVAPAPAGWRSFTDGPGWSAAVPPSYQTGSFGETPQYRDPATGRTLRIATTAAGGGKDDAVQDRRDQAASFARTHEGYQEVAIAAVDYRGYEAADWEFTYADSGADLHAINRVFVVDGRGYSLFFQTRSTDDWTAARAEFDQIAASFRPA